mgnify:CR=1 FL=1|tara:strand:- start:95 stop:418 length:324 start_codon:yes stop_codon:yes gene_type:complete
MDPIFVLILFVLIFAVLPAFLFEELPEILKQFFLKRSKRKHSREEIPEKKAIADKVRHIAKMEKEIEISDDLRTRITIDMTDEEILEMIDFSNMTDEEILELMDREE